MYMILVCYSEKPTYNRVLEVVGGGPIQSNMALNINVGQCPSITRNKILLLKRLVVQIKVREVTFSSLSCHSL